MTNLGYEFRAQGQTGSTIGGTACLAAQIRRARPALPPRGNGVAVFVHPTAEVEAGATLGEGTRVWHQAHIRRDKVFIGPSAVFTNDLNPRAAGVEAPADLSCADRRQRDAEREDR